MKKILLFTFILGSWLLAPNSLQAKPAYRGAIEKQQPDGTTITIYQHGDEFFHYTTLADGTWVAKQADGFYKAIPAMSKAEVERKRMQSPKMRITEQTQQAYPLNLAPRGLVILVNFQDVKMDAINNTREVFDEMLNGDNYTANDANGSARQYFIDQSRGQYQPQFDVVGPVTLPYNMAYYGSNDDANMPSLVKKACALANREWNVDFTQYDNNNDGVVDFVFFIYAGFGQADSDIEETIWPHAHWLYNNGYGQRFYVDDKMIDMYACGSELSYTTKKRDGIGTFCHEFGHVLGLPDLYALDAYMKNLGKWDIMDYGSYNDNGNTPPNYSAYERFFLGWLKPTILNSAATIQLADVATNAACIVTQTGTHNLIGNNPDATEFYLIENRQQQGWDEHIPGHGMLISKIQYNYNIWVANTPNSGSGKCVDLIEADGQDDPSKYYYGKANDAFPHGATEYTMFNKYPLTNITEKDGIISFDFMGGGEENVLNNLEDMQVVDEQILAIYNLFGQQQPTTDISSLTSGIYIIKTNKTTKKISIP